MPATHAIYLAPAPRPRPRRKARRVRKMVMIVFASLWVVGCVVGLCYAFSAVRIKCAGCPECIMYAP